MKKIGRSLAGGLAGMLIFLGPIASAENSAQETEQGLEELQPLLDLTHVENTEGMGLEEMTEVFAGQIMSEYLDAATGFRMQYPAFFQFEEEGGQPPVAVSEDGKASLIIENMPVQDGLDEETLIQAIRMEAPGAEPVRNEQNSCLRIDRSTGDGKGIRTDLYFLTVRSFHHISLYYPAEEKEYYDSFIEYMINSMETDQTDLG